MGTRINVLYDHRLPDHENVEAVRSTLASTLPSLKAVDDYWAAVSEPDDRKVCESWRHLNQSDRFVRFAGPGSFYVDLKPCVAGVRTGGRWRGFLSIEPLRKVHLAAFREIGRALGATTLAYFPDDDHVIGTFWDGGSLSQCISLLAEKYGEPQPSIENISADIAAETDRRVPLVWYVEQIRLP